MQRWFAFFKTNKYQVMIANQPPTSTWKEKCPQMDEGDIWRLKPQNVQGYVWKA